VAPTCRQSGKLTYPLQPRLLVHGTTGQHKRSSCSAAGMIKRSNHPHFGVESPKEVARHPTVVKIFSRYNPSYWLHVIIMTKGLASMYCRSARSRRGRRSSSMRDMLQLFQILDEENTGLLPQKKFEKGLACLGLRLSNEDVRQMLEDFAVKADDLIDYEVRSSARLNQAAALHRNLTTCVTCPCFADKEYATGYKVY
jgi:hypothetical protein